VDGAEIALREFGFAGARSMVPIGATYKKLTFETTEFAFTRNQFKTDFEGASIWKFKERVIPF
jgi:hypothetical protein